MSIEALLDELSAEGTAKLRDLLRQAYERGFREALASSGRPEVSPVPAVSPPVPPPLPSTSPVAWIEEHHEPESSPGVEWGQDDDAVDEPEEQAPVVRPILPHATVNTLRKRIVKIFDLERFDIDVVVCRRGDRDRRQLKGTARLRLYLREGR